MSTEKLHCYASGDGALHFVYLANGKASGSRSPSLQDAKDYLSSDDGSTLRERGWRAILLNGLPTLVGDVSRINANTLKAEDFEIEYVIHPHKLWSLNRHLSDHFLTLTYREGGSIQAVKNYNLRAMIRHFLENEEALSR